jgi:asparagine synthase (glutamine-hydrolysing)
MLASDGASFALLDGVLFDRAEIGLDQPCSDAALVLAAYDRWREGFVDKLRGAFTLAVWDAPARRLLVGRDASLCHCCYYRWTGRTLTVSSDLDALLADPDVGQAFNRAALAEYLQDWPSALQTEETLYADVRRLPPAHVLSVGGGGLRVTRYWDPVPPGFAWATDEEAAELLPALGRAVRRCLEAGADSLALSGGFDSVSLAVIAAEERGERRPLHAISLRYTHPACDEGRVQVEVARALGMPQTLQTVDDSLGGQGLVEAAVALSSASSSPVLTPWQSMYRGLVRSGAEAGLTGLMTGNGGDELYDVHSAWASDLFAAGDLLGLFRFYRACQRSSGAPPAKAAHRLLWRAAVRPVARRMARRVLAGFAPRLLARMVERGHRIRPPWPAPRDPALAALLRARRAEAPQVPMAPGEGDYVRAIRSLLLDPHTLLSQDQAQSWMRLAGVRLLCPYFDRDLFELSLRLRPELLIAGGRAKAPLRRLVAQRLPSVPMPVRKVSFTPMFHSVFRPAAQRAWGGMGGATALGDLGIADPREASALMDRYLAGRDEDGIRAWQVFSTEAWLRARRGGAVRHERGGIER